MADARWNHNTHYYRLVMRAIPAGAQRALDVGCGEGLLTRELITSTCRSDCDGSSNWCAQGGG